jgi:shikimate kinase
MHIWTRFEPIAHTEYESALMPLQIEKPIALVGLMGVGKTTVGRRLAKRLAREFDDSDDAIEQASGRTVAGYFRDHGEADFRDGEFRVIKRLLEAHPPLILATGGGAFIHPPTRELLMKHAVVVWLKGDLETLVERVSRNNNRPLLQGVDKRTKMRELMEARHPIYAQAHLKVKIARGPHLRTVNRVMKALKSHEPETPKPIL